MRVYFWLWVKGDCMDFNGKFFGLFDIINIFLMLFEEEIVYEFFWFCIFCYLRFIVDSGIMDFIFIVL